MFCYDKYVTSISRKGVLHVYLNLSREGTHNLYVTAQHPESIKCMQDSLQQSIIPTDMLQSLFCKTLILCDDNIYGVNNNTYVNQEHLHTLLYVTKNNGTDTGVKSCAYNLTRPGIVQFCIMIIIRKCMCSGKVHTIPLPQRTLPCIILHTTLPEVLQCVCFIYEYTCVHVI